MGWIPLINITLIFFASIRGQHQINRVPYLWDSGNVAFWGVFYVLLSVFYTIVFVFFPENLPNFLGANHNLSSLIWLISFFSAPLFGIGAYLIHYNKSYKEYLAFVNNFLNSIMLKNQQGRSFDSLVYLNDPKKTNVANDETVAMLDDLKANNILTIEEDKVNNRKIIVFTREFQQVLAKHTYI